MAVCLAGSMLATGMAIAVLLLVLEGVLDTGGWVLGLFGISPGGCLTLEKEAGLISASLLCKMYQLRSQYATQQGADACCDIAVQLSVPANMVTVVTSLLLFKLAQVAIVYAAAGVRWANASVRRNWGAKRATSTPAGEGDQDIPTAGTRYGSCAAPAYT